MNNYRLCGGTFFVLLSNARKSTGPKKDTVKGKTSTISEPELLLALARIGRSDHMMWSSSEEQLAKDGTRNFKQCKGWGGRIFQLDSAPWRKELNDCIRGRYLSALKQMCDITERFIDCGTSEKKDELLVKDVLEALNADNEIDDDQEFFVLENGKSLKKSEILKAEEFTLQSFLLGIWHYVITQVDNRVGVDTYNEWCPSASGNERPYTATLGLNSNRDIKIKYIDPDYFTEENTSKTSDNETETDERTNVNEQVGAGSNNPSGEKAKSDSKHSNQFVFNFAQQGDHNTQIGYIENYHKEDE